MSHHRVIQQISRIAKLTAPITMCTLRQPKSLAFRMKPLVCLPRPFSTFVKHSDENTVNGNTITSIFCGNLTNDATEKDLERFFMDNDIQVRTVQIEVDKITKQSKGFGFATFSDKNALSEALELNGVKFMGNGIMIKHGKEIFCGNLNFDTTEKDLEDFFVHNGIPVGKVTILYDKITGDCKGCGFINFLDESAFNKALKLDGSEFDGRNIRIKSSNEPKAITIFCGNLNFDTTANDLERFFVDNGIPVVKVRVVYDKITGDCKGFGFIDVLDESAFNKALQLNNSKFDGKNIRIKREETLKEKRQRAATTVFCGGLRFDVTENDLKTFFIDNGIQVSNVKIACDYETGYCKGFGFVDVLDESAANEALKLNGSEFDGCKLKIDFHESKRQRDQSRANSLYCGNLSFDVTEEDLKNFFMVENGIHVTKVKLAYDNETGDCKGFGFINVLDESAVNEALKLHGSLFRGRVINLPGSQKHNQRSNQVYCTFLTKNASEQDLKRFFMDHGIQVRDVKIPVDKRTKQLKTFGFATLSDETAVSKALELNGVKFKGQGIIINHSMHSGTKAVNSGTKAVNSGTKAVNSGAKASMNVLDNL